MAKLVIHGAQLKCGEGTAPCGLKVGSSHGTSAPDDAAATVEDYKPSNISGFGMCKTQANPQVASATSAAQGVLTPQKCSPVITSAWSPGASVVTIDGKKALSDDSTCSCQWSGTIEITDPASEIEVE